MKEKSRKNVPINHGKLCITALKAIDLLEDPPNIVRRVREDPWIIYKDFVLELVIHILKISTSHGYPISRKEAKDVLSAAGIEAFIDSSSGKTTNKWIMRYELHPDKLENEVEYTEKFIRKHMTKKRYTEYDNTKERDIKRAFYEAFGTDMPEELLRHQLNNQTINDYAIMFLSHHYSNAPPQSLKKLYRNRKKIKSNTVRGKEDDDDMGMCIRAILSLNAGSHGLYKKTSPGILKSQLTAMTLSMGGKFIKKNK